MTDDRIATGTVSLQSDPGIGMAANGGGDDEPVGYLDWGGRITVAVFPLIGAVESGQPARGVIGANRAVRQVDTQFVSLAGVAHGGTTFQPQRSIRIHLARLCGHARLQDREQVGDDIRRRPLDVRAGAGTILRKRAELSRDVISELLRCIGTTTRLSWSNGRSMLS